MIRCDRCEGECQSGALYCVHCGARLSTQACRKCGEGLPEEAAYCARCGYPAHGNVCARCGKVSAEDVKFCPECGNALNAAQEEAITAKAGVWTKAPQKEKEKRTLSGKGAFAYVVSRAFVLPALLLCMFICSFFGMFRVDISEVANGMDLGVPSAYLPDSVSVTGFDAVRGIFLLTSPPTEEERDTALEDFLEDKGYSDEIAEYVANKQIGKTQDAVSDAITAFGVLRLCIAGEDLAPDLIVQTILWGLTSLSLMVLSLTFLVITLLRAIHIAMRKRDDLFRHESLPLSLMFALAFTFVLTGGAPAGAALAVLLLSVGGLAAGTVCKFAVEKAPVPNVLTWVRRGVCAVLVVLLACFATSDLVTIGYKGTKVQVGNDAQFLYGGMENKLEIAGAQAGVDVDEMKAVDLDKEVGEVFDGESGASVKQQRLILKLCSPIVLCNTAEAADSMGTPITAMSWLLFFANLFLAGMTAMALLSLLQETANPGKTCRSTVWMSMLFVAVACVLGFTVPFAAMASSVVKQLKLHFTYGVSGLIITAAVLALCNMIFDIVTFKFEKRRVPDVANEQSDLMEF